MCTGSPVGLLSGSRQYGLPAHGATSVAPNLYVNISPFLEEGFGSLETPDRTGFQGLTTTAIVKAFRDDDCLCPALILTDTDLKFVTLTGTG